MRTALICEQWKVPIAANGGSGLPWFLDWVERRPKEVSDHVACGYWCYAELANALLEFDSVTEYFGGAGFQSTIIQNLFSVKEHRITDVSVKSCDHLISLFRQNASVSVKCVDTFKNIDAMPRGDLIGFDAGDLTALTLTRQHGEMLSKIVEGKPAAIVLTDIAGPRLHLQRSCYSKIVWNDCINYPTYLHGVAEYIRKTFGYDALCIYYSRWSAVMALLPKEQISSTAHPVQVALSPVGFQWV